MCNTTRWSIPTGQSQSFAAAADRGMAGGEAYLASFDARGEGLEGCLFSDFFSSTVSPSSRDAPLSKTPDDLFSWMEGGKRSFEAKNGASVPSRLVLLHFGISFEGLRGARGEIQRREGKFKRRRKSREFLTKAAASEARAVRDV